MQATRTNVTEGSKSDSNESPSVVAATNAASPTPPDAVVIEMSASTGLELPVPKRPHTPSPNETKSSVDGSSHDDSPSPVVNRDGRNDSKEGDSPVTPTGEAWGNANALTDSPPIGSSGKGRSLLRNQDRKQLKVGRARFADDGAPRSPASEHKRTVSAQQQQQSKASPDDSAKEGGHRRVVSAMTPAELTRMRSQSALSVSETGRVDEALGEVLPKNAPQASNTPPKWELFWDAIVNNRCLFSLAGLGLALIATTATFGMVYLTINDVALSNIRNIILCGFAVGISLQLYFNHLMGARVKSWKEKFENFNPEEVFIFQFASNALNGQFTQNDWLMNYIWFSVRTGMALVMTLERLLTLRGSGWSSVAGAYKSEMRHNKQMHYGKALLTAMVAATCLLLGIHGFNIFGDISTFLSIAISDVGAVLGGAIVGYYLEKRFPANTIIDQICRFTFVGLVNPGRAVSSLVRMIWLGVMVGYFTPAIDRNIDRRRINIGRQAKLIGPLQAHFPKFFEEIQASVKEYKEKISRSWRNWERYNSTYLPGFFLLFAIFSAATGDELSATLALGLLSTGFKFAHYLTKATTLTAYQDLDICSTWEKQSFKNRAKYYGNYLLRENPLVLALPYVYSLRWYFLAAGPNAEHLLDYTFGVAKVMLYASVGIFLGAYRGNDPQLPFLDNATETFFKKEAEATQAVELKEIAEVKKDVESKGVDSAQKGADEAGSSVSLSMREQVLVGSIPNSTPASAKENVPAQKKGRKFMFFTTVERPDQEAILQRTNPGSQIARNTLIGSNPMSKVFGVDQPLAPSP